jgi:hypothetical protein
VDLVANAITALIALVVIALIAVGLAMLYRWGAGIAERKGRSRALGWWAVAFGVPALAVLYLLPGVAPRDNPQAQPLAAETTHERDGG